MRRMVAILALGMAGLGVNSGCGWSEGHCPEPECPGPDPEPDPEPTCEGVCVAYMDASWDMALVGFAPQDGSPFHCPPSAPEAGLTGEELAPPDRVPHRVLACSALPEPTCSTTHDVCMPQEPKFAPCILQAGDPLCPAAYPTATRVLSAAGIPFTVCCEAFKEPA